MNLSKKSQWNEEQISRFLSGATLPIRLSFLNKDNEPQICSLWFLFDQGALWAASHENAFLIRQLKRHKQVAFEVSTNDYPYKGVRGKAEVELRKDDAEPVLKALINKYLGDSNSQLASWLLGRAKEEYAIKISPTFINSWDFSDRMEK